MIPGLWHNIFNSSQNISLKHFILFILLFSLTAARAQQIDSIYVDLYTDSLKKGTYNYINIDGKLSNGRFIPLDSTALVFTASDGKFSGNSLWLDPGFNKEKVTVKVVLRSNPSSIQPDHAAQNTRF